MAETSAPLIALTRRGVVRVAGPDAAALLDRLLTADASSVVDAPRPAALLTPQGKILHELWIHRDADDAFALDLPHDGAAGLVKRLALFRLKARADIADISDARIVLAAIDGRVRRLAAPGDDFGADPSAYDAWRVADGRPEQGVDYAADEAFPADVNLDLLGGVDYAKGCFVGQEVVSRMKRRGIIRKRTLILRAEGAAPARGAEISAGDVRVGNALGSAGDATLALVRLDRLAGADLAAITVEGRPARITFPEWFPEEARRAAGDDAA